MFIALGENCNILNGLLLIIYHKIQMYNFMPAGKLGVN